MKRLLLILFFLFLTLSAQAQQTIWVPSCAGTDDTAAFTSIISAIGSNTGTVRLPYKNGTRCAVNTLSIPSNVAIDNTDGTGIRVNSGQTLTVLGARINPAGKTLFFGPGSVTISGGTYATVPGTSLTDNAIARWDLAGGLLQNSPATLSDGGDIATPGKTLTFGDVTATDASRMVFRTQSTDVYSHGVLTSNFTNGVTCGLTNYKDQTFFASAYNSGTNGVKITPGLVNFGWAAESKFCQAPATAFQSEIYFSWTDPTNVTTIRPFGMVINHTNSTVVHNFNGEIDFFRNAPNQTAETAFWGEQGTLRLLTSDAAFIVPNNIPGFKSMNAAGSNVIPLIGANASDKVVIDPGGGGSIFGGSSSIPSVTDTSTITGLSDADTGLQWFGSGILSLQSDGANVAVVNPTYFELRKPLTWDVDNTQDIGKRSGTNFRPRDVFIGRNLEVGNQIQSTVTTGTAPLTVASTTPVANLTLTSHPQVLSTSGGLQTSAKMVIGTATLSGGTLVVTFTSGAVFGNTNYVCTGANQTNANAFKIVNTSASSITITGTGTDIIGFHCIGN